MFEKSKTPRLRGIWTDGRTIVFLAVRLGPELASWAYEGVDVRRLSPRRQLALGLGALAAVGVTTAGVIARRVTHRADAPTPAT